jgi:hypothetical protein
MRIHRIILLLRLFVFASFVFLSPVTKPQTVNVPSRITEAIDNKTRVTLRGNTHPLARPEYDRGAAPDSLPMERMLLVLTRSPEREAALTTLLDEQQDKSSPNFHRWLTPEEFGRQFGAPDADIQAVTGWLTSQGFRVNSVAKGRTVIEFSGDAGLVRNAFNTQIHKYVVNGEEHWANASDPQIPAALAPVVAGVATLHNFYKKPQVVASDRRLTGQQTTGSRPLDNLSGGQHALGPADYAVIYNINPLYQAGINGTGTTIAVVGRSNINIQDVRDFRKMFGLPVNDPQVVLNGPDPGIIPPTPTNSDELEADLDVEWSGAVAPNATVKFVVSASTFTDGLELSELYIIDNNLGNVMTESFGQCEAVTTSTFELIISLLAEQTAAQGITHMVSSGDAGAEGCDGPTEAVASGPISVNVLASTPFTVAVGGTMFNENGQDSKFWKSTNGQSDESAISYIPEDVWNESCAAGTPNCQKPNIPAGGGGASIFFPKPSWQSGVAGIPNDGARDLPDVSLTAAGHDPYLICFEGSCSGNSGMQGPIGVAGTSAAAPSFAAIMALVNQKTGSRQGQADYVLYRLAETETLSQCNGSNAAGLPASNCIFNDVTVGNNAVPGEVGFGPPSAMYESGVGYDLATGLGSVNVANLVNNWNSVTFSATTTALGISPTSNITHGTPVNINITVAPQTGSGMPTGDVSLLTSTGQSAGFFSLSGGAALSSTTLLPGGSYTVAAHYAGDGTFGASDSAPVSVTVSPEASTTAIEGLAKDQNGSFIPFTTGPFGSQVFLFANVGGQSGNGTPTGTVNFTDNGSPLAGNPYALNSLGDTFTPNGMSTFAPGQHSISASYSGDASFAPGSTAAAINFTITPGLPGLPSFSLSSNPATISIAAPGQSGSSTITVTGTGGFAGTVNLGCSISPLPVNNPPACFVNAPSVVLSATNTTATATLRISTTAGLASGLRPGNPANRTDYFVAEVELVLACMFLLAVSQEKKRRTGFLGLTMVLLLGITLSSCAGGGGSSKINFGTAPGAYTVTVSASSGNTTQTTSVLLNVAQK